MIWHLNDDKSVFVSNKVIIFEINFQFSIGKVENFLAENHTLLSDLLRLCKMFIYIPLTWFWSRRWLCVGWKSKKSPKNRKSNPLNCDSPMSHTNMNHTSFESQYSCGMQLGISLRVDHLVAQESQLKKILNIALQRHHVSGSIWFFYWI